MSADATLEQLTRVFLRAVDTLSDTSFAEPTATKDGSPKKSG